MTPGKKRICNIVSVALVVFILFSVIFTYFHYLDIKKTFLLKLSAKMTSLIGQRIVIGDLSLSSLAEINLYDIQIDNPEGFKTGRLLRIKKIFLKIKFSEILYGKLHFTEVSVYSPELAVIQSREGRLNISDKLRLLMTKKVTTRYQIDEFHIASGIAGFNNDIRYQGDHINLELTNLSSEQGTKTSIKGSTSYAGGNVIKINGWAYLRDEPKKFNISVSSRGLNLLAFREIFNRYRIDTKNTDIAINITAKSDAMEGIILSSHIQIKKTGLPSFKKKMADIRLDADVFYCIVDNSLTIHNFTARSGDVYAAHLKGVIKEIQKNPSYEAEIKIDGLDLSALDIMKGVKAGGIITSDTIHVKGKFDKAMPEISGSVLLAGAFFRSNTADMKQINAKMAFSSGKEISATAEASAKILKARGYTLRTPSDVSISINTRGTPEKIAMTSSITLSPVDLSLKTGKDGYLESLHLEIDGTLKEKSFSGKASLEAKGLQYADYALKRIKGNIGIDYKRDLITVKNVTVKTVDIDASASQITVRIPARKDVYAIDMRDVSILHQAKKAGIYGTNLFLYLNISGKNSSADFDFSDGSVTFQDIRSEKISGSGSFNKKEFYIDIPNAEIAGGKILLSAQGKTSRGPFPIKADMQAEEIDLNILLQTLSAFLKAPYSISGKIKDAAFSGTIDSVDSVRGNALLDGQKISILAKEARRNIVRDASLHAQVVFGRKDLEFTAEAATGTISAAISGFVKGFLKKERAFSIQVSLPETNIADIRTSFWDIFPDSLLYGVLDGSISSGITFGYREGRFTANGKFRLKDFMIGGEYGEYSAGPINGVIPLVYGEVNKKHEPIRLPSFERSEFGNVSRYYSAEFKETGYNKIVIGSFHYGFRLLKDIKIWMKQDGNILNVGRLSANIFGGRLNGSAIVDMTDGLNYKAGILLEGLSLKQLCDDIEPIRGYISGKVDGTGTLKGSGIGLLQIIGMGGLWTYSTQDEKTKISKEFLQKVGGPSVKAYLGDRPFNKGIMSLYLQKGYVIFRELEISNRNFFGIQDLSIKVAPLSNRIAIDHLMWTIVEAAQRAKRNEP